MSLIGIIKLLFIVNDNTVGNNLWVTATNWECGGAYMKHKVGYLYLLRR